MKRTFTIVCAFLFAVLFFVSGFRLAKWYLDGKKSQEEFNYIEKLVGSETETDEPAEKEILEKYAAVYAQNNDFAGWITIDDTKIDYPVMQCLEESDFYLNHNFEKQISAYGVPYVRSDCDIEKADNLVIFGHHMDNGSMFSDLCKYSDKGFYENHKTIRFDTKYSYGTYEIISVFKTDGSQTGFAYHDFVEAESEEDFNEYVSKCKELSLYEIEADAKYGDKLISLSTCEYSRRNGRMVIVAKLVE